MLVMKFGGASVAGVDDFAKIADLIIARFRQERELVVVISAMAGVTDQLSSLAKQVHPSPPKREHDMLVSVGERMSMALLAMALHLKGYEAVSFTGSQSGIITTDEHTEAKIVDVKCHRIQKALSLGKIVIVAGFQGVSLKGEITTLGRGGSDTSAVALAVALGAPRVEFYKDVPGIFSEDPKQSLLAKKFSHMSYQEAFLLALSGAKILHGRSILLAEKNGVLLSVRHFGSPLEEGTLVGIEKRSEIFLYEGAGI